MPGADPVPTIIGKRAAPIDESGGETTARGVSI